MELDEGCDGLLWVTGADGVRSRIIAGRSSTQNSSEFQFLEAAETAQNWLQFSEDFIIFVPSRN